jgi:very-short-patch-repair endonuclease
VKKHPLAGAHTRARTSRQNMTEAEKRVWQILRSHQTEGYRFRRQVPIGRYIADFACDAARLIVEIDGGQHARSSPHEAERSGFLQTEGYRILRFWNNEVLANLDGVHRAIAEALHRVTPTQTLPHQGGGPTPLLPRQTGGLDPTLPPPRWGRAEVGVRRAKATESGR